MMKSKADSIWIRADDILCKIFSVWFFAGKGFLSIDSKVDIYIKQTFQLAIKKRYGSRIKIMG